ncbi:Ubiquitin-conjugating enzyme E2 J1, partial [Phaethon lepturus]
AVKRLMKEAAELKDPTDHYHAQPLEDNLFEWHFTVRGPPDSDFDGGIYHGRIVLPPEYPMKPPSIILLTANGRFEVGKKICLSISGHHPETWQPSWSIRTALLAIIGFMPTKGEGAIGSLDYTPEERRALAKKSQDFCCEMCGTSMKTALLPLTSGSVSSQADKEAKELARQISFKVK